MKSYETGLAAFDQFLSLQKIGKYWPPKLETIVQFISYLSLKGLSPNTAKLYIVALGYKCKIQGFNDTTQNFLVHKMLEGFKRLKHKPDSRLPITKDILFKLILKLPGVCHNVYETKLYKAAFTLAFWGLFRVGEITKTKDKDVNHILAINDIKINKNNNTFTVVLRYSKTDQTGKGVSIEIRKVGNEICPFDSMQQYLAARPPVNGPLFCHFNREPLTRYQFSALINKTLAHAMIDPSNYKSHSFRLGGATSMSVAGRSVDDIKTAGRWKSSAYKNYIRPN